MIRVLLADDHGVVRDGLRRLFEDTEDIRVVSLVGDGKEAVAEASRVNPDVIVMDISMPVMSGISATRDILERAPQARVLMLSIHTSAEMIGQSLAIGARGYVLKESASVEVVAAIRAVAAGRQYLGEGVAERIFSADRNTVYSDKAFESLTSRERGLLRLITEGKSNAQAGLILRLSPRTVETYRSRLMQKLQITDLPTLVKFAIRHGITTTE
jgi:DNA-binding NarL/FixJ family response regulator